MSRIALTVEVDVEFTVFLYLPFQQYIFDFLVQSNEHRLSTELIFSPSVSLYKQSSSSILLLLANQSALQISALYLTVSIACQGKNQRLIHFLKVPVVFYLNVLWSVLASGGVLVCTISGQFRGTM